MSSFLLTGILGIILATGCETRPDVLPADKMESILIDVHLAEAWSTEQAKDSAGRATARNSDSLAAMYRSIYSHHKTTDSMFRKSMDWYRAHPAGLDSIYTRMIVKLSAMELGKEVESKK